MKRATALLSTWYLAAGGVVAAVTAAAPPEGSHDVLFVLLAAQFIGVMILARRFRTVPARIVLIAGLIVGLCTVEHLIVDDAAWYTSVVAVSLGIVEALFLLLLVAALRRRNGAPLLDRSMAADAAIVALCGWIAGWSLLVQDVTAIQGGRDAATILYGVAQPISLVTLFVAAVVVAGRRVRVPALWMLMAAVASATAADLVASVLASGHLVQTERWVLPLHIFAFFAGGAAMLHPSVTDLRRPPGAPRNDMPVRIGGVALCLVMAFVVLAATSPDDTIDLIVRTASTVALAGVVTIRVMSAARANHRAQAALLHGAQTDPLTGLANRGVLLERINDLLRTSWGPEVQPTLFFVDLDRFKNINDSLGHAAGDEVLIKVAKRLIDTVPESATVARMSGDEYVVLDPASRSQGASMALAERMLAVFREPLQLSQGDVFVTASIGVAAISATTTTSPEDLVRHADTAMYRAKDAGRNCVAVYDESMHERVAHRLAVETALYRALDRRELRLFHQPILDLTSGEVVGFEALMRWQQSDGTIVSPGEFIPIAEDTGTIVPIGSWALLEALSTLRKWIDEGVCNPQATMSVNVSPRQLADSNFPAIVSEALTRSGVSPQLLWLEVTESVMITEPELALATLRRLRSLGVRVAMDDFGTGYSSLSLLQKFPLQRIKIDRAFVHGVADNPNDRSLVRTIVAMGRSLGLDMVAEGVESVHQLQVLSDLGCTKAQGFLISHPVPTDAMRSTVAALERLGQFPGLRPNIAVPAN